MANNISGNPWYIDTTGTLLQQRFKFEGGLWTGAAAGDVITLTDNVGRIVYKTKFPTDLQPVAIPKVGWVNGLIVTAITGYAILFPSMK